MNVKKYYACGLDCLSGEPSQIRQSTALVLYEDFDRVTAERDALQLRLNAVEEENDSLREGWYKDESDNNRFWPEELHDAKDEIYGFNVLLQDLLDYDISIRARQRIEEALSISKGDKTTEYLEKRP